MQQGLSNTEHQPNENRAPDHQTDTADCYMLTTLLGGVVVFTALGVSLAQEDYNLGDWLKTGLIVAKVVTPALAYCTQRLHEPRITIVTNQQTGSQRGRVEVRDSFHSTAPPVTFEVPLPRYPQAESNVDGQETLRVENPMDHRNALVGAAAPAVDPSEASNLNPEP